MIASGNGVGVGVGVGTGVAVGLGVGVGETEGGGLNFGPGQPARKMQARSNGNFPIIPPATLRVAMRAGQHSSTPLPRSRRSPTSLCRLKLQKLRRTSRRSRFGGCR